MSFTVFLGNLPTWVTADDIKGWLNAENLVADAIKVIRNPETQESKGFAFIEAPNSEEMNAIIRRFDRAPLEDRLLRANPAQPPKPKGQGGGGRPGGPSGPPYGGHGPAARSGPPSGSSHAVQGSAPPEPAPSSHQTFDRPPRRGKKSAKRSGGGGPQSAFAEELAKVL
jgi:RNA recognition motif-containing protein